MGKSVQTLGLLIKDQFDEAFLFLGEICQMYSVPPQNLFLVPGNHDVNRSACPVSPDSLLKTDNKPRQVNQLINDCGPNWKQQMSRLAEYREFLKSIGNADLLQDMERLVYATTRKVNGITVGIAGLNSAWSCFEHQPKGSPLWLGGDWQIQQTTKKLKGVELKIALMHHPPAWFSEEETELSKLFPAKFHFLLHGHEHNAWVYKEPMCRIAAGACYGARPAESGYSFVRLDFDQPSAEVWVRRYAEKASAWGPELIPGADNDGRCSLPIFTLGTSYSNWCCEPVWTREPWGFWEGRRDSKA